MAVSARLARMLHQNLGDEAAEDLVNWMGQVESNRSEIRETMDHYVARTDNRFAEMDARIDARFTEMNARMDARFAEVNARMDARFHEVHAKFVEVTGRMDAGFARLEIRFERRFGDLLRWSFVFWCGAVAAVAALAKVLR